VLPCVYDDDGEIYSLHCVCTSQYNIIPGTINTKHDVGTLLSEQTTIRKKLNCVAL